MLAAGGLQGWVGTVLAWASYSKLQWDPLQTREDSTSKVWDSFVKICVRKDRKHQREKEREREGTQKKNNWEKQEGISGSEKEEREEEVLQVPEKIFPATHWGPTPVKIVTAIRGHPHAGANGYYWGNGSQWRTHTKAYILDRNCGLKESCHCCRGKVWGRRSNSCYRLTAAHHFPSTCTTWRGGGLAGN